MYNLKAQQGVVWLLAGLAVMPCTVMAKVSQAEADKLGTALTAVGAEPGASADGSIPAYTGEKNFDATIKALTPVTLEDLRTQFEAARKKNPADFDGLTKFIDNFQLSNYQEISDQVTKIINQLPPDQKALAQKQREQIGGAEKPIDIITKDNLAKYADKLTDGHKALFTKYPTYKMIIYPSVRSGFFPAQVNEATKKNAVTAELKGTDEVTGAELGFPFPIPQGGAEVIWNHKLKFRGTAVRRYNNQAIVKPDGTYKISKLVEDVKFKYASLTDYKSAGNLFAYYLSEVIEPARVAGQTTLVHEVSGKSGATRSAWIFNPGLGRVNRAPDVSYDTPYIGTDGEQFTDQVDVFNGAMDRYDWKLIGKKEMYIPYNSFLINTPMIKYKDIIRAGHINQNLARYEMHRVWIVEATVKAGLRHQFKKRRFYVDEDSWSTAVVDCYDNRDQLWKVQEAQLITAPFVPTVTGVPELIYDLQSGRYFVTALVNEDKITDFTINFEDSNFQSANLKRKSK